MELFKKQESLLTETPAVREYVRVKPGNDKTNSPLCENRVAFHEKKRIMATGAFSDLLLFISMECTTGDEHTFGRLNDEADQNDKAEIDGEH